MTVDTPSTQKIHPHKFTLWVAMGSIIMMFAALTSAYIVKKNQSSWLEFELPLAFWYSTATMLISSLTFHLALKAFKAREALRYRALVTVTALLGLVFLVLQYMGFAELQARQIALVGNKSNSAASFLFVITALHMVHVLGGVIALAVIFARAFSTKQKSYSALPLELVGTYWHFVGVLWVYLFVFFHWIG